MIENDLCPNCGAWASLTDRVLLSCAYCGYREDMTLPRAEQPTVREHPAIFSARMVQALIGRRKSQTRRLPGVGNAYWKVGDRLWVREPFKDNGVSVRYKADMPYDTPERGWIVPMFMPRKLSRINLEITAIRKERLQEISETDAQAEGWFFEGLNRQTTYDPAVSITARLWFSMLWDELHERPGERWIDNPTVKVFTFKVLEV